MKNNGEIPEPNEIPKTPDEYPQNPDSREPEPSDAPEPNLK